MEVIVIKKIKKHYLSLKIMAMTNSFKWPAIGKVLPENFSLHNFLYQNLLFGLGSE
jgi:hypothetical protein